MKQIAFLVFMLAGLATAQEVSKFKVFGFADFQTETYLYDHSFNKSVVGQDTNLIRLGHANLYFDFKPNNNLQGLVEVGFAQQDNIDRYNVVSPYGNAITQAAIMDGNGHAMTDDQIIDILTENQLQHIMDSVEVPAAQQEAFANAQRSTVRAGVVSAVTGPLAMLRGSLGPDQPAVRKKETQRISLVRAQFDLLLNDAVNVRFGKFITPAGIWNVDHASPVVLSVRQPIQTTTTPIFPESQTGIMVFGRKYLGDHDLIYNAYVTTGRSGPGNTIVGGNYDNSIDNLSDLAFGGHIGLKLDMLKGISIGASAMTGTMRQKYQTTRAVFQFSELLPLFSGTSADVPDPDLVMDDQLVIQDREFIYGGDLKVEVANLLVQGEFNYRKIDNEIQKDAGTTMMGYYGLLGYKVPMGSNFSLTPYAMFERVNWEENDEGAAGTLSAEDLDGFTTLLGGLNLSIFTNFRIKVEYARLQLHKPDESVLPDPIGDDELLTHVISTQFSVAF